MELTANCIIERKEKRLMAELTAESTFSECAEFYLNNKLLTADEGMEAVRQKTKCSISIYPAIGHVSIKNLNYSECISLFSELRNKNYSKSYICACWYTIKQVVNMTVELGLIENQNSMINQLKICTMISAFVFQQMSQTITLSLLPI